MALRRRFCVEEEIVLGSDTGDERTDLGCSGWSMCKRGFAGCVWHQSVEAVEAVEAAFGKR